MKRKFYITNSIPYVNAKPHIGHALEFVQSDVLRRYYQQIGYETLLLCGSDENALKNVQAAEKTGMQVQEFVDKNAKIFEKLAVDLNIHFDRFQKGSDQSTHFPASQKLWDLCKEDIYKKDYQGLYCVGCETFYTEDELNDNRECYEHPGRRLDIVSESNYFFKLSKFKQQLIDLISSDTLKIMPIIRKNEVLSFLKGPLHDISISRTNERAKNWGVPVPGDNTQRMYVWFDALNIYQSGIGFGLDEKTYNKWWPADIHVIGKGIARFHAVYWPAFLMSARLMMPKSLFVHGYLTIDGQKMSKTLGNIIDPFEMIEKYGTDAVRYYLLREIPTLDDGDFSENRMEEIYSSDLANELGNLVSRITTLAAVDSIVINNKNGAVTDEKVKQFIENFAFNKALEEIWTHIKELNKSLDEAAPWKQSTKERNGFLQNSLEKIQIIAHALSPFLPETAEKIQNATTGKIKKISPLFPRR